MVTEQQQRTLETMARAFDQEAHQAGNAFWTWAIIAGIAYYLGGAIVALVPAVGAIAFVAKSFSDTASANECRRRNT
jgi:hypothetical protein